MQTVKSLKQDNQIDEPFLPEGYKINGWIHVLSHEMNVLFSALCEAVFQYDTKEEIKNYLSTVKGLNHTFTDVAQDLFQSEEDYLGYTKLLEKHKKFLQRSNFAYPTSRDEALKLFEQWGLLIDKGDVWDIPVLPFPDAQDIFTLKEEESAALNHLKLEAIVHPVFSKLILTLHEKDENSFALSKNDIKQMLNIGDELLFEVLVKLTPYLQEPIENLQDVSNDEKMEFTVVWERVYEDFLGEANPQTIQQ